MPSPLLPSDPVVLGRYRLEARLSQGGMGSVYLGRADGDGRQVAVKVIRPEFAHDQEFRARFRSEVKRARGVPAFCTAAVLDADPEHETPYLVFEFVDGPPLNQVVREQGPFAGHDLVNVAVGVATALTAIHGAGVIHRDLKPGNVLFARGGIKVIDFGIARAVELTSAHTRTDQMVGTVSYMAPERFEAVKGAGVSPAADVFAWGVLVAYAATGRTPFEADSPTATAMRILTQPPDLDGLDGPLRHLVDRALDKDPARRPSSQELLNLLVSDGTVVAPAVASPVRPDRKRERRWVIGGALAAVACVLAGVVYLILDRHDPTLRFRQGAISAAAASADPVLSEGRTIVLYAVEQDRNLSMPFDKPVTLSSQRTADETVQLMNLGDEANYMVRTAAENDLGTNNCLTVSVLGTTGADIETRVDANGSCLLLPEYFFRLSPTGATVGGRPSYWLSNDVYGYMYWDDEDDRFTTTQQEHPPAVTSFVLAEIS
ncbi:serine/threonine protein kinase [Actinoplanes sp. NPDC051494]|uniref:serine/threonine protein kinase n=1 Tax=Actinoplanes sp. NPDC051494 TaxID=3363907 RepID=UPI00379EF739